MKQKEPTPQYSAPQWKSILMFTVSIPDGFEISREQLKRYREEKAHGIVHTPEYDKRMRQVEKQLGRIAYEIGRNLLEWPDAQGAYIEFTRKYGSTICSLQVRV